MVMWRLLPILIELSNSLIPFGTFKATNKFTYYVCRLISASKMFLGHAEWSVHLALPWRIHHSWTRKDHKTVGLQGQNLAFILHKFLRSVFFGDHLPLTSMHGLWVSTKSFFQRNWVPPNQPLAFEEVKMHFRLFEEGGNQRIGILTTRRSDTLKSY